MNNINITGIWWYYVFLAYFKEFRKTTHIFTSLIFGDLFLRLSLYSLDDSPMNMTALEIKYVYLYFLSAILHCI